MKKVSVIGCVGIWLLLCTANIYSKTRPLEFEIRFDSKSKETYQVKKQMQETFDELVSGLHMDSQRVMVMHNLEQFEEDEDIDASWNEKLILTQGDGLGDVIDGELTQSAYCVEKVQPRSFLQELFQ